MVTTLIASALLLQGAPAEDPVLRKDRDLNCAEWARTANHYLRLGEEKAVAELLDRSGPKPTKFAIRPNHACHILRLIYEPKKGGELRRPSLGSWGMTPPTHVPWLDFPFVVHSDVIFIFAETYVIAGKEESPADYAKYLHENGVFRGQHFKVPTSREAQQALDLLVRTRRWFGEIGKASVRVEARLRKQSEY